MSTLRIRELHTVEDFRDAGLLYAGLWGTEPAHGPISADVMRSLAHAGNYAAGAYVNGELAGASVGFFADPVGTTLHSHITGARTGLGVGLALKEHQKQWALVRGLKRITWTYDPLVRRNAYFNLVKVGARPEEYLTSFYGSMNDSINGGDESDRLLTAWDLTAPPTPPQSPDLPAGALHSLCARHDQPVITTTDAQTVLVDLPDDIEAMRRTDPDLAQVWRLALRQTLDGLLAEGARIVGFHDRRRYVVQRTTVLP